MMLAASLKIDFEIWNWLVSVEGSQFQIGFILTNNDYNMIKILEQSMDWLICGSQLELAGEQEE